MPQFPLPAVRVLARIGLHGLVCAPVILSGADDTARQAVRPRVPAPLRPQVRDRHRHRPGDRVLPDAGLPGVMRRGQGLDREVDRQQHAAEGYFHKPSREPRPHHWPGINHGADSVMPATRSSEGGAKAESVTHRERASRRGTRSLPITRLGHPCRSARERAQIIYFCVFRTMVSRCSRDYRELNVACERSPFQPGG
jgi:hypothetical protein